MSSTETTNERPDSDSVRIEHSGPKFSKERQRLLATVDSHRHGLRCLSDPQLTNAFNDLRVEVCQQNRNLPTISSKAIAFALEATKRVLGFELYDVQVLAANALINRKVAEMQTGEGKTLSAAPSAIYGTLLGGGVHVATPNAYLAHRDFEQLQPVFQSLGISAGYLDSDATDPNQKKFAYQCDVTYGTGYEFGFDYLRDQLLMKAQKQLPPGEAILRGLQNDSQKPLAQRGLGFAIVDEVDNVLVDDATSPQVLSEFQSGKAPDREAVMLARRMALQLEKDTHFRETQQQTPELTDAGNQFIHQSEISIPTGQLVRPWSDYVESALRAEYTFLRDVHYVLDDEGVQIVDESTGRIFADRSWQSGLHQAVEAKEAVTITPEALPLATITRQRFYRLYNSLSGMTGTGTACAAEFKSIYELGVETIPLRIASQRQQLPLRSFPIAGMKWDAILHDVVDLHRASRPVLIGTRTISESLYLADRLESKGLPFELLNGQQDADEAELVSRAGLRGAITIATNLAGRGTDIKLPRESLQKGGLHVIVSECHFSSRVDRQLIGRCGRQGQPGSSQTFVSADDWLFQHHAPWLGQAISELGSHGELSVDLEPKIRQLQASLERKQFAARLQMLQRQQRESEIILGLG